MASRNSLVLRAAKANIDHTLAKYANDSVLEQAIIYAEQQSTATGAATTKAVAAEGLRVAGGRNV